MTDPRPAYLETQIATATPQKLRLMLIEGAIRQAQMGVEHWVHGRVEEGLTSIIRCRSIAAELIEGVRDDGSPLARQVIGIYAFAFKALTEAQLQRDRTRLEDVIRVLQEERQTWQQVCYELPEAPDRNSLFPMNQHEILAPRRVDAEFSAGYSAPHYSSANVPTTSSGFSLEG